MTDTRPERPTPLFSVIVPTYNRATLLREALDSVRRQTFRDFEVVVVDDGSTDDTPSVLAGVARTVPINVVRQANAGVAAARNAGVAAARGRYLAFLDSDDLWYPWTLQVFSEAVERGGSPAAVVGLTEQFVSPGEIEMTDGRDVSIEVYPDLLGAPADVVWLGAGACAFKRSVVVEVGGFSTNRMNFEDLDLWLRMCTARGVARVVAPRTLAYRQHADEVTMSTELSLAGVRHVVLSEKEGRYPGGEGRKSARRRFVTRLARSISVGLVNRGWHAAAMLTYRWSFGMNVREARWRYVFGLPLKAVAGVVLMRRRIGRA